MFVLTTGPPAHTTPTALNLIALTDGSLARVSIIV
jgi:hypothetical protein